MNVIALQWDIARLDPETNIACLAKHLRAAQPEPGDLVLLPELWPTGYGSRDELKHIVRSMSILWEAFLADVAKTYQINLVAGSVPAFSNKELVNRLVVYEPSGEVLAHYDKIHLFPPMKEHDLFVSGVTLEPFPLTGTGFVLGPTICYDLRFPELFRLLATKGANLFVLAAEFPDPRENLWHVFLAARAAENQAYLVACNRIGGSGSYSFFGSSAVYDPQGKCIARLGRDAGFLKATVDPSIVAETRNSLPVLSHTRLVLSLENLGSE